MPTNRHGTPGKVRTLDVTGPTGGTSGDFNLNGIQATPDGNTLIVAHTSLNRDLSHGTLQKVITSPNFGIPTTAALFGRHLAAVNAHFDTGVPPTSSLISVRLVAFPALLARGADPQGSQGLARWKAIPLPRSSRVCPTTRPFKYPSGKLPSQSTESLPENLYLDWLDSFLRYWVRMKANDGPGAGIKCSPALPVSFSQMARQRPAQDQVHGLIRPVGGRERLKGPPRVSTMAPPPVPPTYQRVLILSNLKKSSEIPG
ncbi:hypothetical protein AB0I77_50190 [Streptomyces sp. NPDC050619]|uniref:hypothetical protein n=1 Tax=Streptomyces sp. NPDC050619 TaxID=3157214 RepID=UPI003442B887